VEDDPGVRRSTQLLLQGHGFDTRAYASGEGLLRDPGALNSDCLVADYKLGGMDGIELLKILRDRGWTGWAILITAFASEGLSERAIDSGFHRVFEKPLPERSLIGCVAYLTTNI
jgi:FixJ family two-component response regulator